MRTALMILVACCCLFGTALVAAQPKYLSFNTYTKCTVSPVPEAPVFMLEICQYYPNQTATRPIGNDTHIIYPKNVQLTGNRKLWNMVSFGYISFEGMPPAKYSGTFGAYEADTTDPNSLLGLYGSVLLYSQSDNTIIGSASYNLVNYFQATTATMPWDIVVY